MGNCCPCFKSTTHIYEKIPENLNQENHINNLNNEQENKRKSLEVPQNILSNINNLNNNNLTNSNQTNVILF